MRDGVNVSLKLSGICKGRSCRKQAPAPARPTTKRPDSDEDTLPRGVNIVRIFQKRSVRPCDEKGGRAYVEYRVKTTGDVMAWISHTEAELANAGLVDKYEASYARRIANEKTALELKWMQCGAGDCGKWRIVSAAEQRNCLHQKWYCSMNKDGRKNACSKPQDKRATWPSVLAQNPEMCKDDEDVTVASLATPGATEGGYGDALDLEPDALEPDALVPDDVEDESSSEDEVPVSVEEEQDAEIPPSTPSGVHPSAATPPPFAARARLVAGLQQRDEWRRQQLAPSATAPQQPPMAAYAEDVKSLAFDPESGGNAELNWLIEVMKLKTAPDSCMLGRIRAVENALRMESVDSIGLQGRIHACMTMFAFLQTEKKVAGPASNASLETRIADLERFVFGATYSLPTGSKNKSHFSTRIGALVIAVEKLHN